MIVTLTANPSVDRSASLPSPLARGGVHRLGSPTDEPGGKGVNVARCAHLAGVPAVAVLPSPPADRLLSLLDRTGVVHHAVPVEGAVRTNLTLTEPDGTTTKLNEPGSTLTAEAADAVRCALTESAAGADWVVLAGSLPPGAPVDWYATLVRELAATGSRVAVDTSDAPLTALVDAVRAGSPAPHLLKPNAEELASVTGADGQDLEAQVARGDLDGVVSACTDLLDLGVESVLATLGGDGAVLATRAASGVTTLLHASPPQTTVLSTVGAGDSSLTGYLLAQREGEGPEACLRRAVAYGSAAAGLPGTGLPTPAQTREDDVLVTALTPPPAGPTG